MQIIKTLFRNLLVFSCGLALWGNVIAPRHGRIEGRVCDESGKPLAHVGIVVEDTTAIEGFPEILPLTNEQGVFTFAGLPPGRYTLSARLDGYQTQTKLVTVRVKQTTRVAFVLKPVKKLEREY